MKNLIVLVVAGALGCGGGQKKSQKPVVDARGGSSSASVTKRPQDAQGDATVRTTTGDDLSWLAPVYFAHDSAELTVASRETLARLHDWLSANTAASLLIEGHCDETGTTEYNIGLGQRRAQAIADYLVRLGSPAARLRTISYGSERPVADGHDEVAYAKNRRGELRPSR